jgi:hypothetical protein
MARFLNPHSDTAFSTGIGRKTKNPVRKELTAQVLRELIAYDPVTGLLEWRPRERKWFKTQSYCDRWNNRYAGQPAFCTPCSTGYLRGRLFDTEYLTHRVAWLYMTGNWPKEVDHINHIKSDNRWENLRNVSLLENRRNQSLQSRNTSGVTGVTRSRSKWQAMIMTSEGRVYLGRFEKKEDAVAARKQAEKEHGYHPNHGGA